MKKRSKRMFMAGLLVVGLSVLGHAGEFGSAGRTAAASTTGSATTNGSGVARGASVSSGLGTTTSTSTTSGSGTTTNPSTASAEDSLAVLERSFGATGAQADGYVLHDWAQLNAAFVSMSALQQAANEAADVFGLTSPHVVTRDVDGEHYVMVYGSIRSNTVATVVLSSFQATSGTTANSGQASNAGQTLLVVDVTSQSPSATAMQDEWERIAKVVSENGQSPQISACIEGFVSARLLGGQADAIVRQAYAAVGATTIGGLHTALETSVSGYTPETSQYIVSNGRRMNLQVAVHFDDYHHRTNVLVGTPIITIAY